MAAVISGSCPTQSLFAGQYCSVIEILCMKIHEFRGCRSSLISTFIAQQGLWQRIVHLDLLFAHDSLFNIAM
jgi:hypothetical protein